MLSAHNGGGVFMKKKATRFLVFLVVLSMIFTMPALAHSGRTDSSGGHKDNKNKSGLGSYHYHCGGHPAHLHEGGICPYDPKGQDFSKQYAYKDVCGRFY